MRNDFILKQSIKIKVCCTVCRKKKRDSEEVGNFLKWKDTEKKRRKLKIINNKRMILPYIPWIPNSLLNHISTFNELYSPL